MSKHKVDFKTFLHEGLAEPEFYGDLVCKFRKIAGKLIFFVQFKKFVTCYKKDRLKLGYSTANCMHAY